MSLALETPPAHSRPRPPSTSRRRSAIFPRLDAEAPGLVMGVLGGLRERTEEELGMAGRDALEVALREAWAKNDEVLSRLGEVDEVRKKVEKEKAGLESVLDTLQQRQDEMLKEQARLETDLEGRDELLDRLRKRANEAERLARASARRAEEQEASFEAERQALQAQESHLNQRIKSLLSAKAAVSSSTQVRTVEELQSELAAMGMSHSTVLAQLDTLRKEVHELRLANASLADENEGWEVLLRERTLSGKVREGGLLGLRQETGSHREELLDEGKSQLEVLEEEMEMAEQSTVRKDDRSMTRGLEDGPGSRHGHRSELSASAKIKVEGSVSLAPHNGGANLATELGLAEIVAEGKAQDGAEEVRALRTELKSLREENKALTLYCSKIIDRIIAQPGFEHVLSVDYKTHRFGSRSASASQRGALKEVVSAMREGQAGVSHSEHAASPKEFNTNPSLPIPSEEAEVTPVKDSEPITKPDAETQETKSQKRTRRGFSLDFRMLGFGSSTASSPAQPKPNPSLKPLALASRTTSMPRDSKVILGRRLARQEEDDDDKRERHRLEASLKLWGVDRLSTSDASPPLAGSSRKLVKPSPRSENQEERQALIQPRPSTSVESPHRSTPLSRLSSALGSNNSPLSPISPDTFSGKEGLSPELIAQAAIRAFDEREAEQAKALSLGETGGSYTSPKTSAFRRTSQRRSASGEMSPIRDAKTGGEYAPKVPQARGRGSVSTLWSMGSSRPNSRELERPNSQELETGRIPRA